MASAHHPHGPSGHPTPAINPPDSPPLALYPPSPPSPTRPRMTADSTRPHPTLTSTALGYRERKGEDALPLPGCPLKPRPSQRATARAKGQKPEGRTRSCAALSCWVLHPAGSADLVGGCCYVVNSRDAVTSRSVLAEGAPALRIRPAPWFPICSPAALSPRPAPGAECNAASWPQEGAVAMRKILQSDPNPRSSSGSGGPSHRARRFGAASGRGGAAPGREVPQINGRSSGC